MTLLLLLSLLAPLPLAALVGVRGPLGSLALRLAPWAALPALGVAMVAPGSLRVDVPWLLFGARFELDLPGRVFLLFTALLWTAAGVYARAYVDAGAGRTRFTFFFLLTLSGNLGLTVAQDLASFYLFFTLMTFAAFGLIVHERGPEALRAGKVYMILAVLGEGLLLGGGLLATAGAPDLLGSAVAGATAASPMRDVVVAMLFLGFGVKAGIVPLHVWLPLAHPVAPTPASAVLSGAMIEAGVLGWLRFLPVGESGLPGWGALLIGAGSFAAFYGVLVGLAQTDPKTILAYSSISQIGLMTAAVGAGLADPALAVGATVAVSTFALHHGLTKGALFLGVGVAIAASRRRQRRAVFAGLTLVALAMAGAPLTAGSAAKERVHALAHATPGSWGYLFEVLLPLSAVATTILMAHFLVRTLQASRRLSDGAFTAGLWIPWAVVGLASAGALWSLPAHPALTSLAPPSTGTAALLESAWPVATGGLLFCLWRLLRQMRGQGAAGLTIPAGDLLVLLHLPVRWLRARTGGWSIRGMPDPVERVAENWYAIYAERERWAALLALELRLTRWEAAGLLFLLVGLMLTGLLALGGRF